jgi:hypothetical protein
MPAVPDTPMRAQFLCQRPATTNPGLAQPAPIKAVHALDEYVNV